MPDPIEIGGAPLLRATLACKNSRGTRTLDPDNRDFDLVVYLTDACNARCDFCGNTVIGFKFDFPKFEDFLLEAKSKVCIRRVKVTGGEPTLMIDSLMRCLQIIQDNLTVPVMLHTNGANVREATHPCITNVSISRHHWNHEANERIFKCKFKPDYISAYRDLHKVNLSCNLIRGQVDTETGMRKVLDFALETGVPLVGFVGLLPLTEAAKNSLVSVPVISGPDILPYENRSFETHCSCAKYCYLSPDTRMLPFYARHNTCPSANFRGRIIYLNNRVQPWFNGPVSPDKK
jgi:hypothetical protein